MCWYNHPLLCKDENVDTGVMCSVKDTQLVVVILMSSHVTLYSCSLSNKNFVDITVISFNFHFNTKYLSHNVFWDPSENQWKACIVSTFENKGKMYLKEEWNLKFWPKWMCREHVNLRFDMKITFVGYLHTQIGLL